jgi:putative ABC transport system permease protein
MNNSRLVAHSLRMVGRYKLRSFFMMLGSLIGVAAITFVVSIGQSAQRKMLSTVSQIFGESSIIIQDGGGVMMGAPRGPGRRLKIEDISAIEKELPEIQAWDPQQALSSSVRRGDAANNAQISGESERAPLVWNRAVVRGEFFDASAVAGSSRVAVIGPTVVRELFGNDDPLGADIQIGSVPFRVIGVLESWGTDAHGMDRDNQVIVPITTLMRRLTNVDTISSAKIVVSDPGRVHDTQKSIQRILRERHSLAPGQPDDFSIITATQVRRMMNEVQRVMYVYLPLVAAIALIAGGIVSASLMLVSVNERTGEIGLRQAVGARPDAIRLQFMLETATTTLLGGLVGIVVGFTIAQLGANRMHLGAVRPWTAAVLGLASSAVVGALAGVLPATRAAKLRPVDALR